MVHPKEAIITNTGVMILRNSIASFSDTHKPQNDGIINSDCTRVTLCKFEDNKFLILDGNHRVTLFRELKMEKIYATVLPEELTPQEVKCYLLVRNSLNTKYARKRGELEVLLHTIYDIEGGLVGNVCSFHSININRGGLKLIL